MLTVSKVTMRFGGLVALREVDFTVKEREIVGLIGPNGSGKTTLFNCINGVYRPTIGTINFNEKDITGLSPEEICNLGIGRTFQIVRPFLNMTGLENVLVGTLYGKKQSIRIRDAENEAIHYLKLVGLGDRKDDLAKSYTLTDRKTLEIARTLATNPELILLDEVVGGLNPTETLRVMKLIKEIRDDLGITVLWIEHVMKAVMTVAERVIVLHHGAKIFEGTPEEVAKNEEVVEAYLGKEYVF